MNESLIHMEDIKLKTKNKKMERVIAVYDAAIAGIPSQIAYGSCKKVCHGRHLTISSIRSINIHTQTHFLSVVTVNLSF